METKVVRQVTMKCAWKRCRNEFTQQNQTARGFCSPKCLMAYRRFKKKWLAELEAETLPTTVTRSEDGLGVYIKANYTERGWEILTGMAAVFGQTAEEMVRELVQEAVDRM